MQHNQVLEFRLQLDVLAALLADLEHANDEQMEVIETLLARLAAETDIPNTLLKECEEAYRVVTDLRARKTSFEEGYQTLCSAVDILQRQLYSYSANGKSTQPLRSALKDAVTSFRTNLLEIGQGDNPAPLAPFLGSINELASQLEEIEIDATRLRRLASRMREQDSAIGRHQLDALLDTVDRLIADAPESSLVPELETLVENLMAEPELCSGHLDIDTANPELAAFVSETREYLAAAEVALIALEKRPSDAESLNEVFRCFHNVKGISGFLNLEHFQQLAHSAESLMDMARSGQISFTRAVSCVCFDALDLLKDMVDRVEAALSGRQSYEIPGAYAKVLEQLKNPPEVLDAPEPQVESPEEPALPKPRVDDTVKVNTRRLDSLVDAVGELAIAASMVTQDISLSKQHISLAANVSRMGKIIRELQELAVSMRMVSLESTFHKMSRVARDLSIKSGIPLEFTFSGEETELDRAVVEEIQSPLVHMVRNAVDHGIEPPSERAARAKPEVGKVHLSACHEGGSVVIRISDDGRGLDAQRILTKAISSGLVEPAAELTDREIYSLIFKPGFSTAGKVTDISGRGVGMDVVKQAVDQLRGRIEITSQPGEGTTFSIRLPLTMAMIDGMVVTVGKKRFIIPTIAIQESLRPSRHQISTVLSKAEMVSIRGSLVPLFRLHRVFGIHDAQEDPCQGILLVITDGDGSCALLVDDILGQQHVVVKPVGHTFDGVSAVSGAAIMGDGLVALILDAAGLIATAQHEGQNRYTAD